MDIARRATLHQLRIFDAVARCGSVAQAAKALHLTPPAVSIQVKQLAEAVGAPLLEQVGKRLYLTEAGRLVAAACREVLDRLEGLSQDVAALQGLQKGRLGIAILTTAKYLVPRLLGAFSERHPHIELALVVGNRETLLERMGRNEDDLYILGQPPRGAGVVALPFAPNHLVAIAYPGHPLARARGIPPAQFGEEPFIAREEGSGTRLASEAFFRRYGVRPRIRMTLGSNEAIKQMVAGRLGVSILSQSTVLAELETGELVMLDVHGLPIERQWYIVYLEGKRLTPAAEAFCAFLLSHRKGAKGGTAT